MQREAARRRDRVEPLDRRGHDVRLGQQLREAGRLVRGEDDPGALAAPARDGGADAADGGRRQGRLVPAEGIAARRRAVGVRLPGELERARRVQRGLPVARRGVGVRPAPGQLAGRLQLARSLVGLGLQGVEGGADVGRLVDEPDGVADMVERRGRRQDAAPDLRRIAQRPRLDEARRSAARRSGSRVTMRPSRASKSARLASASTGRRNSLAGRSATARADRRRAGRPGRRRAATRPRRRTTPRAPAAAGRPGSSRRCRRGARTRRDRRPRAPTRSPGPRGDGGPAPGPGAPPAGGRAARLSRSATGRVRWKSAWTLATRMRGAAGMPSREGGDAGRRLVADQLRALVGQRGAWLQGDDGRRPRPGGQLLRDAIGDLRVAGDPDQPLPGGDRERRGQERLGAVRHRAVRDVPQVTPDAAGRGAQALGEGLQGAGLGQQRGQDREVGRAAALGSRAAARRRPRPRGGQVPAPPSPTVPGPPLPKRRSRPRRPRIGLVDSVIAAPGPSPWHRDRQQLAPAGPRMPDAVGADGRLRRRIRGSGSRAGGPGRSIGVVPPRLAVARQRRRSIGRLRRVELPGVPAVRGPRGAVARPVDDRIGRRIDDALEIRPLAAIERAQHVVDGGPRRLADADAQARELLAVQLADDRAQAVVAAGAARRPQPEASERQREVVGDHEQVVERRVVAGQDLAHGQAGLVHERLRLDELQVEGLEAAPDDARGVALLAATRPAGPVGQAVEHHPADVVTCLRVAAARVSQPDDDLHPASEHADWARIPIRGGPETMVAASPRRPVSEARPVAAERGGRIVRAIVSGGRPSRADTCPAARRCASGAPLRAAAGGG